jgi:hypothetical protein
VDGKAPIQNPRNRIAISWTQSAYVMPASRETAIHEAGHAVATFLRRRALYSVSAVEDDDSFGRVVHGRVLRRLERDGVALSKQNLVAAERTRRRLNDITPGSRTGAHARRAT